MPAYVKPVLLCQDAPFGYRLMNRLLNGLAHIREFMNLRHVMDFDHVNASKPFATAGPPGFHDDVVIPRAVVYGGCTTNQLDTDGSAPSVWYKHGNGLVTGYARISTGVFYMGVRAGAVPGLAWCEATPMDEETTTGVVHLAHARILPVDLEELGEVPLELSRGVMVYTFARNPGTDVFDPFDLDVTLTFFSDAS